MLAALYTLKIWRKWLSHHHSLFSIVHVFAQPDCMGVAWVALSSHWKLPMVCLATNDSGIGTCACENVALIIRGVVYQGTLFKFDKCHRKCDGLMGGHSVLYTQGAIENCAAYARFSFFKLFNLLSQEDLKRCRWWILILLGISVGWSQLTEFKWCINLCQHCLLCNPCFGFRFICALQWARIYAFCASSWMHLAIKLCGFQVFVVGNLYARVHS